MELDIKVIELTNKVDINIGIDKEFKELVKSEAFSKACRNHVGGYTPPPGVVIANTRNLSVNSSSTPSSAWGYYNFMYSYLLYLMQKHNKQFKVRTHYISSAKYVTKELLEYFGLEDIFPKQLVYGSDFVTMLEFLPLLVRDKRSKFFNKDLNKMFEEL